MRMRANPPIIPMHYADGAHGKYSFRLHKHRTRQILRGLLYPFIGLLFTVLLVWNYTSGWIETHDLVSRAKEKVSSFKIETVFGMTGTGTGTGTEGGSPSKYMLRRRLISTFLESTRNETDMDDMHLVIPAENMTVNMSGDEQPSDPFKEFDTFMGVMKMFAMVNDMDYWMISFKEIDPSDYNRPDIRRYATSNFMKYNMYDDDMKKRTSYMNDDILKFYICSNYLEEGVINLQVHKCTREDLFIFNAKSLVDAIDLDMDPGREAGPSSSFAKKK